jgi:cycloartenol synthase
MARIPILGYITHAQHAWPHCREELFCQDYNTIDWNAARTQCSKEDLYYPQGPAQRLLWWTLYKCENVLLSPVGSWLRKRGLEETMKLMKYEDESTNYIDIGPVNKVINMLACWIHDPEGQEFRRCSISPSLLHIVSDTVPLQQSTSGHLQLICWM